MTPHLHQALDALEAAETHLLDAWNDADDEAMKTDIRIARIKVQELVPGLRDLVDRAMNEEACKQ